MEPLTQWIDHTCLKADATPNDIRRLCDEAKHFRFFAVCVNPVYVALAKSCLEGSSVKIATVVGFPLGANTSASKAFEAAEAVRQGADEVDMVINIGAAKAGDFQSVRGDISRVLDATRPRLLKVIIETALLTRNEITAACKCAKEAGADFVKTSTGFSTSGAKVEDVRLMRETVGPQMGVKASGGLKTRADLEKMLEAGATRLGTSSAVQVLANKSVEEDY